MSARERLTVESACGLLRSRLRQHLFLKAQEVYVRRGEGECFDMVLDFEKSVDAAAHATLISALKLWGEPPYVQGPLYPVLVALMRLALTRAVEKSQRFIHEKQAEQEHEDVKGWVLEFVDGFKPDVLLVDGVVTCASAI
jgi:hypothetical protein